MRIVDTLSHPDFRIVLYATETHFLVEIEAGPMRQSYRYSKEHFGDLGTVKATITAEWLESVRQHFNSMYVDWKKTWE